jgi:hypothetical protein
VFLALRVVVIGFTGSMFTGTTLVMFCLCAFVYSGWSNGALPEVINSGVELCSFVFDGAAGVS